MRKIGFCYEDEEEEPVTFGYAQGVQPPDLNNDLVDTINNLVDLMHQYGGQIGKLTIDIDDLGHYNVNIKYNSGRKEE